MPPCKDSGQRTRQLLNFFIVIWFIQLNFNINFQNFDKCLVCAYLNFIVLRIACVQFSFKFHYGFSIVFLKRYQLAILLRIDFWHHATICMSIL